MRPTCIICDFFTRKDPRIDTRILFMLHVYIYYKHYGGVRLPRIGVGKKIINELFIDESPRSFSG